jgi:hypothetical protein
MIERARLRKEVEKIERGRSRDEVEKIKTRD